MILSGKQLRLVYEGLVLQLGHPDPIGYMTRAYAESGGDTNYYDLEGRTGFMPVSPERALEMTGVSDVVSLENNVATTVLMEMMLFQKYRSVDAMVVAFHFGEEAVNMDGEYPSTIIDFFAEIAALRPAMTNIVSPPRATVRDVVNMLDRQLDTGGKAPKFVKEVVNKILENR